MNRRGFLEGILAAGMAPAVFSSGIASGILMPVRRVWMPPYWWEDGLLLGNCGPDYWRTLGFEPIVMNGQIVSDNVVLAQRVTAHCR